MDFERAPSQFSSSALSDYYIQNVVGLDNAVVRDRVATACTHFALQVQEGNFISGARGNARGLGTQKLR
jgi:hypothetical protein